MDLVVADKYISSRKGILRILEHFEEKGRFLGPGDRNTIKIFDLEGQEVNVKSFKVPNVVNQIAYGFFRKSKAERSYRYAQELLSREIGTPDPIAYAEDRQGLFFTKSYYISRQLQSDLTYRRLVEDPDYPDRERILRAFTRFTFRLHEQNIQFLDHSPGNTLIQVNNGNYQFYLVDLNRMNFKRLSYEERLRNFSRLTPHKEMVCIMASEYAKCIQRPEEEVLEKMWFYTDDFQRKFHQKKALKKKLKFWKKKS